MFRGKPRILTVTSQVDAHFWRLPTLLSRHSLAARAGTAMWSELR
jgi:hypothetical protein